MPIYKTGDMWSVLGEVDYFLITTNAVVKKNGALVMGRGIAQQARDRYPGIDQTAGKAVAQLKDDDNFYGVIIGLRGEGGRSPFGLFQVKRHWGSNADPDLIKRSTADLAYIARTNPHKTFALNFPGIGNGGLPYEQVKPIVDILPDNVQIWSFK